MNPCTPWTKERIARLKLLWVDRTQSVDDVAKALGFSRNAVIGKAWRLNLGNRKGAPRPVKRDMRDMKRDELLMLIRTPFPVVEKRDRVKH